MRVTAADLAAVRDRGTRSPRKRARLCTHPVPTDPLHEMLICLARGTYVRPHRHAGKSESFHIIEGELDVLLFHDGGSIREVIRMGPYQSGKVFFYRLMEPCFHTVLAERATRSVSRDDERSIRPRGYRVRGVGAGRETTRGQPST